MKVQATAMGYVNNKRVKEGEIFELPEGAALSDRWMMKVDADGDDAALSVARNRPARVQQAPDARDVEQSIAKTVGDDRVAYSTGTRRIKRPAPLATNAQDSDGQGGDEGGDSTQDSSGGKLSKAIHRVGDALHVGKQAR